MAMRLLVIGSGGMLGRAVARDAARLGHDVVTLGHQQLDITDADHVARIVGAARARAVINCAAYTDVDGAEAHEGRALRVNGDGAGHVARAAAGGGGRRRTGAGPGHAARGGAEAGARVVQVSTDYVFDGAKREPWVESDPVAPLQAYGRTKLAGEVAVAESGAEHAIVRTAWLFGAGGPNFVETMLRLGAEKDEVTVVTDQRGGPTWTGHLAPALVELAERHGDVGVFHASGPGECSWYEFAVEILHRAHLRARAVPTTSAQFARPARRPEYSVLGTERAPGMELPHWSEGLKAYLDERAASPAAAA